MDNIKVKPDKGTTGVNVATDNVGGVHFPVYKIAYSIEGATPTHVSTTNPLPTTGLTDTELRASPVSTTGLTDTELRASPVPTVDPMLEISRGLITGHGCINKFGRNSDVAADTTEDVWDGSGLYSFPATALMTSLSQTTDQAAMRGATIEAQGLDSNWDPVTQTKALDGTLTTNVVAWDTPMIRCFRLKVLADVVSTSTIRCHNAGETQDYAVIGTGYNQTQMAIYTVPSGKKAYMTGFYAQVNPATNKDPTSNPIRIWARDNENGYERQLKHISGIITGHMQHFYKPYPEFTQKTDIYMDASPVGKAVDISAGFDLILVDD